VNIEALPELPAVYADPKRVRQILLNLVGNAIKFTPAGGTITIAAWRPANEAFLQISVRDTGCGIAAENCEHIFERLYQVKDSLEQSPKGLGLGLFICRDLVTSQGGRIWVESALTRGTTFHFTLPLFAQG
jgi:signal transduction histidine kinase